LGLELDFKERDYILYLDNLFTNIPILKALKELSVGAIEITRKNAISIPDVLKSLKQDNIELI